MAEVTVKQLADEVGTPVERLLQQMQEAGLPQTGPAQAVSDDEKQALLAFLKSRRYPLVGNVLALVRPRILETCCCCWKHLFFYWWQYF